MKTLKQFASQSHIEESLIRAVVRQVGSWAEFQEIASDVVNNGAGCGYSGFIYYMDTAPFTDRNQFQIWHLCKYYAEDFGVSTYKLIGDFNCLKMTEDEVIEAIHGARGNSNRTYVLNALAWFALEEVCRSFIDCQEQQLAA